MRFWDEFTHEICPNKCTKYARWEGNILKCSKCGEEIALKLEVATPTGTKLRLMVLPRFGKQKEIIEYLYGEGEAC